MLLPILPTRAGVAVVAALAMASAAALIAGVPVAIVGAVSALAAAACIAVAAIDLWASRRAWRAAPLRWQRRLPPALAVGMRRVLEGSLVNEARGAGVSRCSTTSTRRSRSRACPPRASSTRHRR